MALSPTALTRLTVHGARMFGSLTETVTYHSRTARTGSITEHAGLVGHMEEFVAHYIGMQQVAGDRPEVKRGDRLFRVATSLVTWTPTLYDSLSQADGTLWLVMEHEHGVGRPWWIFHLRKSPT